MANNDIIPQFDNETSERLTLTLQNVPGVEGCLVIALNGYIDTYNAPFFQKQVQRAIAAGFVRLIFNCGSLNYVSSTGIGSFSVFLKTVKPQDGDVVLLNMQPEVLAVFQLLGFSPLFTIKDTLQSAIDLWGGDPDDQKPAVFPQLFSCPLCSQKLKTAQPGHFRCPACKAIMAIDRAGAVVLG